MKRILFCQISPLTYKISRQKEILKRKLKNKFEGTKFADTKSEELLPYVIYKHNSLIRRKLNNVDINLQNNKAKNLSLAAPKINNLLIYPGETFSFWRLVGDCSKKKGYLDGLTVKTGSVGRDIGGGMCQFSNLIHWMVLHSNLEVVEYHHHNGIDMFPDFGRKVPFGTGTSIMYNTLDYRFYNPTKDTIYQLITYTTDEYLFGELRSNKKEEYKYHVNEEYSYFSKENDGYYRNNLVTRRCIEKSTGNEIWKKEVTRNHAKVLYDPKFILPECIKEVQDTILAKNQVNT